jgi:hypothetical protein
MNRVTNEGREMVAFPQQFRGLSRVYAPPPTVVCAPWSGASPLDDINGMSTAYSTNPIIATVPQTHDANGFVCGEE